MLEVLLVVVVLAMVASISNVAFINWRRQVLTINNKAELKSILIRAQQLATAAAVNDNWGVHLETDSYTLFHGSFFNENSLDNEIKFLTGVEIKNASTSISDGAGGYGPDVVFAKFTGQTFNTGTISIITPDGSIDQDINIESSGRID